MTLLRNLPYTHPYRWDGREFGGGQLWRPSNLGSALALWLDAEDAASITLNGATVSQWNDKSGNGRHVSQATAASQPTYSATGMVGKPTLDWGTATNVRSLFRTGMTGYSPVRYFGVADYDGPNPFNQFYGLVSHNFLISNDLLITNAAGQNWYFGNYILNGGGSSPEALPTISAPFVFATDFDQSPNRSEIFIGSDRNIPDRGWIGKISEIIALNTLPSTADCQRLEGYLAWKWALEANLPVGHPFKSAPPFV